MTSCDISALWLEHKSGLKNFIYKRVKDNDITNDILQEVLLKTYNFCLTRSGIRNMRSWLFQVAHNCIVDHYRKKQNTSFELAEISEQDEQLGLQDAAGLVVPLLGFLPEKYAIPLKLADIDDLKYADIAHQLGLTLTATKSRVLRARQLLRNKFLTCCHLELDKNGNLISAAAKESCAPLQEYLQTQTLSCCTPSV